MSLMVLAALLAVDPTPASEVLDEKERVDIQQLDHVRLSLPTQQDVDAWQSPGLRVQLGYGYSVVHGWGAAWSFRSQSVMLRPGVRIDRYWALGVALLYGTGPGGVRWSVTAEPSFHPWRQLALTVGLGYGGLAVSGGGPSSGLRGPDQVVSRNLTDGETMETCTGSAVSSLLRAEYLFVVGPLFATGPYVQGSGQWTRCQETFGRIEPETGRPVVLTQWWRQAGVSMGWWFAWR
jgi:hypothetical protein